MTALDIYNRLIELNAALLNLGEAIIKGRSAKEDEKIRPKIKKLAEEHTRLTQILNNIVVDDSGSNRPKLALILWPESWENMFDCLHHKDTRINSRGNFWAAVQALEEQASYLTPSQRKEKGVLEQEEV